MRAECFILLLSMGTITKHGAHEVAHDFLHLTLPTGQGEEGGCRGDQEEEGEGQEAT